MPLALHTLRISGRAIFFATLINAGGFLAFALADLPSVDGKHRVNKPASVAMNAKPKPLPVPTAQRRSRHSVVAREVVVTA